MKKEVTTKKAGGKLLRVKVDYTGDTINNVVLGGDFFMHPEEKIEELENSLKNTKVADVKKRVYEVVDGVVLYGVDADTIVESVLEAAK
ncbi:MAG: hypothetical protein KKD39_06060 [Candidatus Altiarchaeota archaeon]|nr:hypothetical protein [Candidatus Altiarchaeota archaeon]